MNVELYISQDHHIVIACEGKIERTIEGVLLHDDTHHLSIMFTGEEEAVSLNCPVDSEIIPAIKNEKFCALGFFNNGKLLEAQYVPFQLDKTEMGSQ